MHIHGRSNSAGRGRKLPEIHFALAQRFAGRRLNPRGLACADLCPRVSASGFTLVELIITIVIVGFIALALIMAFRESLLGLALQRDLQSASRLSEDLMNEIRSRYYADPQSPTNFGPELPEEVLRRNFDDVDDYDGWSESPPRTIEGAALSNYAGFTRQVFVENVTSNFNGGAQPDNSTVFKRITVIVGKATLAVSNVSVVSQYDSY